MPSASQKGVVPPILDFSAFRSSDTVQKAALIHQISQACKDKGFFQLTNHGIPIELQDQTFDSCREFFDLSVEDKMKLQLNEYHRGYEALGAQMLEPGAKPDVKEGYYIGEDLSMENPRVIAQEFNCGPNLWPEKLGIDFQKACMTYYYAVRELAKDVMCALALGLGLEENWFDDFVIDPSATLRFVHYPPTPTGNPKERGIGAHRDFGCVTLLLQDDVGGLQVLDEGTGSWIDVVPTPNAYVVNLGNLMMRWTNHRYTSNTHRVLNFSSRERYSIPFFFTGNPLHTIGCIPGCEDEDSEGKSISKYTAVSVRDFLHEQFVSSYVRASEHTEVSTSK